MMADLRPDDEIREAIRDDIYAEISLGLGWDESSDGLRDIKTDIADAVMRHVDARLAELQAEVERLKTDAAEADYVTRATGEKLTAVREQRDAAEAEVERLRASEQFALELRDDAQEDRDSAVARAEAAEAEAAALRERVEKQVAEWRAMSEDDSNPLSDPTVGHVLWSCADDLAAAVLSVPTEQPDEHVCEPDAWGDCECGISHPVSLPHVVTEGGDPA